MTLAAVLGLATGGAASAQPRGAWVELCLGDAPMPLHLPAKPGEPDDAPKSCHAAFATAGEPRKRPRF